MKSQLIAAATLCTFCAPDPLRMQSPESSDGNHRITSHKPPASSSPDLSNDHRGVAPKNFDNFNFTSFESHLNLEYVLDVTGGQEEFGDGTPEELNEECYPTDVSFFDVTLTHIESGSVKFAQIDYHYSLQDEYMSFGTCIFHPGYAVETAECFDLNCEMAAYDTYAAPFHTKGIRWSYVKTKARQLIEGAHQSQNINWQFLDSYYAYLNDSFILKFDFQRGAETTKCTQVFLYDRIGLSELPLECKPL